MEIKLSNCVLVLVATFFSCSNNKSKDSFTYFGFYQNNKCLKKDSIIVHRKVVGSSDTFDVQVYAAKELTAKYNEFEDPQKGIFRQCGDGFSLIYNFRNSDPNEITCPNVSLFQSSIIEQKKTKSYTIDGTSYEVRSFAEYSPSLGTIVSYYERHIGFFCYYIEHEEGYLMIDSLNNTGMPYEFFRGLENTLINDTAYFGAFISRRLPKILPPEK